MKDFIKNLEQYYGMTYNGLERTLLESYLNAIHEDFKKLLGIVIKSHSKTFRSLPDIAIIEKCIKSALNLELEASKSFNDIVSKANSYADLVTDNGRVYNGLCMVGGWLVLCNSLLTEQKWLKKAYIVGYCNESYVDEVEIYRGIGTSGKQVVISNNPDKIKIECDTQNKELEDFTKYVNEGMGK